MCILVLHLWLLIVSQRCQRWVDLCSPMWFCSAAVSGTVTRSSAASRFRAWTLCWTVHPNTHRTTHSGRTSMVRLCRVFVQGGGGGGLRVRLLCHILPSCYISQSFDCNTFFSSASLCLLEWTARCQISVSLLFLWDLIHSIAHAHKHTHHCQTNH